MRDDLAMEQGEKYHVSFFDANNKKCELVGTYLGLGQAGHMFDTRPGNGTVLLKPEWVFHVTHLTKSARHRGPRRMPKQGSYYSGGRAV